MELAKLCTNYTACVVEPGLTVDHHGADVLLLIAKLTWHVDPRGAARYAIPQRSIRVEDDRRDSDNPLASIRLPSDFVAHKPGTDVIMIGKAYPPEGVSAATWHDVSLEVGALSKAVRVFGPRVYMKGPRGIVPGPPAELGVTPLDYELAAGGMDVEGGEIAMDAVNPAGRGTALDENSLVGRPAHQLEIIGGTEPAGFGAIGPTWEPRRSLAGTYDDVWARTRQPFPPSDLDPRFFCVAHPDLQSEVPLTGTEPVRVIGATPEGSWCFQLPAYAPRFDVILDGTARDLDTHLDTFLIDADNRLVELTWRATQRIPRKIKRLEQVFIRPSAKLPEHIVDAAAHDLAQYRKESAA